MDKSGKGRHISIYKGCHIKISHFWMTTTTTMLTYRVVEKSEAILTVPVFKTPKLLEQKLIKK